jgi:hypothetical protein
VISSDEFTATMSTLLEVLPMQRRLTEAGLVMLWETFPASAKADLTVAVLRFCVSQRLLDPAPPKELAPHLALLRYAYPLEHDRPVTDRGLRADLRERMAFGDRFHDPAPARHEQAPPERPRLPGGGHQWHPSELDPAQLRRHVQRVEGAVQRIRAKGADGREWKPSQLAQGRWWFERALAGFWPLECDDAGIAAAWILRNGKWADDLLKRALTGKTPALPAAEGVPVGAIFGGVGGGDREAPSW